MSSLGDPVFIILVLFFLVLAVMLLSSCSMFRLRQWQNRCARICLVSLCL